MPAALAPEERPLTIAETVTVDTNVEIRVNTSNEQTRQLLHSKQAPLAALSENSTASLASVSPSVRQGTTSGPAPEAPAGDHSSSKGLVPAPPQVDELSKRSRSDSRASDSARYTKRAKLVTEDSMSSAKEPNVGRGALPPSGHTLAPASISLSQSGGSLRKPTVTSHLTLSADDYGQASATGSPPKAKKRFRGLLPNKMTTSKAKAKAAQVSTNTTVARSPASLGRTSPWIIVASHLDFASPQPQPLPPTLTLPPKLAQRKQVGKLSLLFSLLDDDCLLLLSQCSKLYRYSGIMRSSFLFHVIAQKAGQ